MEENFEGVNESETAEQTEVSEVEVTEEGNTEEVTEGTPEVAEPELDRNAIFADARRRAEAEFKRKQAAIDAQYAEKFKDYRNPITGQPIRSAQDYYDALSAQEQVQAQNALAEKGLDPKLIENAVNNSPAVKTANLVIAEQRARNVKDYIEKQVVEIGKIDPDIHSVEDLLGSERYSAVFEYVDKNRLSIVDAYKLVYADKLNERKTAAVKQQAINNAKSQQHLKSTDGGQGGPDGLVNIPESQLAEWKSFFPKATSKELKELYNNSLHK